MFKAIENFYSNHTQSNITPMNLGNKLYQSPYTPVTYKNVNVVFQPMKHKEDADYVAIIDEEPVTIHNDLIEKPEFIAPVEDVNMFSIGDDVINNFFVGSVTVVGLFVLFSFLQKHNK